MKTKKRWIILFLMPTLLLFILLYAYPIGVIFTTCFTDWKLGKPMKVIGFENFIRLWQDSFFRYSFSNTLKWLVLHWAVLSVMALLTALMTYKPTKGNRIIRILYLIPNVLPIAVVGYLFYFIFHPTLGLLNGFLSLFTMEPIQINWLQNPDTAFEAVTAVTIFYGGIFSLLLSAEIASIPGEVIESARIDGAGEFQVKRYIILPLIQNIFGTVLVLATVQCLKTFEVIFLTSNGGPGKTTMNLSLYTYRTALISSDFGYANTISAITILIGAVSIILIHKLMRMGKDQEDV